MAWESQDARDEAMMASANVTALTFTVGSNRVLTYASGGLPQYTACIIDTVSGGINDVTSPAAAGAKAIGIVQEYPAVGPLDAVRVRVSGVSKVRAAGVIAIGDTLMVADTTGRVQTATAATANFVIGRALEAAVAADDLIAAEIRISDGKVTMP
jgi:hypothetical protein